MEQDALHGREVILRQLHNERSGIAGEHFGLLEDDAGDNDDRNAEEVHDRREPPRAAHQEARDQRDNGELRAAGHEGGRNHGHAAVLFVLNGTGSHNAGHAAAGRDHERNEGLAGQAEFTEDPVHDERDTGHIAAVFQQGQEEEHDCHLWGKADRRGQTADDAVDDEGNDPFRCADVLKERGDCRLDPFAEEGVVGEIGDDAADGGNRDVIDQRHDDDHGDQHRYGDVPHLLAGVRAVQIGGLGDFIGDAHVGLPQEEGAKRRNKTREHQREDGVGGPHLCQHLVLRNNEDLARQHHLDQHQTEQQLFAGEFQLGKGIARHGAEHHCKNHTEQDQ